jgi:hypothetical protein
MNDRDLLCSKCWHTIHEARFYIVNTIETGDVYTWHEKCKSGQNHTDVFFLIADAITSSHPIMDSDKWRSVVSVSVETMPILRHLRIAATPVLLSVLYRRLCRWLDSEPEWNIVTPDGSRYNVLRLMYTITPIPSTATITRACSQLMTACQLSVLNGIVYSTHDDAPMHPQYVKDGQVDILRATPAEVTALISTGMRRVVDSYIVSMDAFV